MYEYNGLYIRLARNVNRQNEWQFCASGFTAYRLWSHCISSCRSAAGHVLYVLPMCRLLGWKLRNYVNERIKCVKYTRNVQYVKQGNLISDSSKLPQQPSLLYNFWYEFAGTRLLVTTMQHRQPTGLLHGGVQFTQKSSDIHFCRAFFDYAD